MFPASRSKGIWLLGVAVGDGGASVGVARVMVGSAGEHDAQQDRDAHPTEPARAFIGTDFLPHMQRVGGERHEGFAEVGKEDARDDLRPVEANGVDDMRAEEGADEAGRPPHGTDKEEARFRDDTGHQRRENRSEREQ